MKLLVLAQTPPPLHGQSMMVRTLLEGLEASDEFEVHHVNLGLSSSAGDIGRWRPGKVFAILRACREAMRLRRYHGPMALYYIPAPGKRGALYRDWLVMALCRRHFSKLILHWHASGLGAWLAAEATQLERAITHRLLGHADLSIVLSPALAADSQSLAAKTTVIVPNGIADLGAPPPKLARATGTPCELLYVGLCTASKGIFDLLDALALAEVKQPGGFRLTVAGGFADTEEENLFRTRTKELGTKVNYVGFADESAKRALYAAADVVCFPTHYPHEGQPLVLIEAMAYDLPIVATRWRAIPEMLPSTHARLVEPSQTAQLAEALLAARAAPHPNGAMRAHYLEHFTRDRHLAALRAALKT